MDVGVVVLKCARKHDVTDEDIKSAIANALAARYRDFDAPAHIALAGPDGNGNLIEVLCAEQSDGTLIAYHAMKLTKKMASELGL